MDKKTENAKELNSEKLDQASGGGFDLTNVATCGECPHPDLRYKTGKSREDTRWIFFSKTQFEYYCPKCKKTFWEDEKD